MTFALHMFYNIFVKKYSFFQKKWNSDDWYQMFGITLNFLYFDTCSAFHNILTSRMKK